MPTSTRPKKPLVLVIGNFPDLFMEGINALEVNFTLNAKEESPDIIFVSSDMSSEAMSLVKKYEAVPVIKKGTKAFFDFNPLKEIGNAFLYSDNSAWHMLEALIRAQETYKFEYDWKVLKNEVLDFAKYSVDPKSLIKES
jgi:hypothetical protein